MRTYTSRRGLARIEAAAITLVVLAGAAILSAASSATRERMSLGESMGNLKRLGDAMAAFGPDHADRFATFSWMAGDTSSQYEDLRNPATDLEAAAYQAVDIIRRRANLPTFPKQTAWIPHVLHSYSVLTDYLDTNLPIAVVASPEDAQLLTWASDPAAWQQNGAPHARAPFWSSYELPAAFWDLSDSGNDNVINQTTHAFYLVPSTARLGGRRWSEVSYPSHKAMWFDRWQRHFGPRVGFALYREARVPVTSCDGSVAVRASNHANRGWNPQQPWNPNSMQFTYSPAPHEPPALQGVSQVVDGRMRWTRHGLFGRDYDGAEPQ